MKRVLVDTNVASFFLDGSPEAVLYAAELRNARPVVSVQTVAEMLFGATRDGWGGKRLAKLVGFLGKVESIPADDGMARIWATISASAEKRGVRVSTADAWVAATALREGLTLLSHDKDFRRIKDCAPKLKLVCRAPEG